jgi:hypothetical protein
MGVETVPDQHDGSLELDVGSDDRIAVVAPGEGIASSESSPGRERRSGVSIRPRRASR